MAAFRPWIYKVIETSASLRHCITKCTWAQRKSGLYSRTLSQFMWPVHTHTSEQFSGSAFKFWICRKIDSYDQLQECAWKKGWPCWYTNRSWHLCITGLGVFASVNNFIECNGKTSQALDLLYAVEGPSKPWGQPLLTIHFWCTFIESSLQVTERII